MLRDQVLGSYRHEQLPSAGSCKDTVEIISTLRIKFGSIPSVFVAPSSFLRF